MNIENGKALSLLKKGVNFCNRIVFKSCQKLRKQHDYIILISWDTLQNVILYYISGLSDEGVKRAAVW